MGHCPTSHDKARKKQIEQMKRDKTLSKGYEPTDKGKVQNSEPGPDEDGRGTEKTG